MNKSYHTGLLSGKHARSFEQLMIEVVLPSLSGAKVTKAVTQIGRAFIQGQCGQI